MASSKPKKPSKLDELLSQDTPQGPIRRGVGMSLSTDAPVAPAETLAPAKQGDSAQTHKRTNAPERVNRGYKLREDLIKRCKRIALEEDRNLYEVMEEALEEWLARKEAHK